MKGFVRLTSVRWAISTTGIGWRRAEEAIKQSIEAGLDMQYYDYP